MTVSQGSNSKSTMLVVISLAEVAEVAQVKKNFDRFSFYSK